MKAWNDKIEELKLLLINDQGLGAQSRFPQLETERREVIHDLEELHGLLPRSLDAVPKVLVEQLTSYVDESVRVVSEAIFRANELIAALPRETNFERKRQEIITELLTSTGDLHREKRPLVYAMAVAVRARLDGRASEDQGASFLNKLVKETISGRTTKLTTVESSTRFSQYSLNSVFNRSVGLRAMLLNASAAKALESVVNLGQLKDNATMEAEWLLKSLEVSENELPLPLLDDVVTYLHLIVGRVELLNELGTELANRQGAPNRQSGIPITRRGLRAIAATLEAEVESRRVGIYALMRSTDTSPLNALSSRIDEAITRVDSFADGLHGRLESLIDLERRINLAMDRYTVSRIVTSYAGQMKGHAGAEEIWLRWSIFALAPLLMMVGYIFGTPLPEPLGSGAAISAIVGRTLLFTLAAAFLQFTVKRWNLERDLKLRYEHRISTVEQYIALERMVSETEEGAKDRLRTALAKYLFSDPQTGYGAAVASELNISPLIQFGETLAKKSAGPSR